MHDEKKRKYDCNECNVNLRLLDSGRLLRRLLLVVFCLLLHNNNHAESFQQQSSPLPTLLNHNNPSFTTTRRLFQHHSPSPYHGGGNTRLYQSNEPPTPSNDEKAENNDDAIDVNEMEELYRVRLSRAPGIEWGTDLSFAFVYVRSMEPAGDADLTGLVNVGDQLCEMRPLLDQDGNVKGKAVNLIGAPFDYVMDTFASLDRSIRDYDLVFYRGTKKELIAACNNSNGNSDNNSDKITITVIQNKGSPDQNIIKIPATRGVNVRQALADANINVYQSITRWTNCSGKQLCGTCIVNIADGVTNTNRKSHDEGSTLRENPDSYRLSCVTFAYGDVTVETYPPVNAAQWTR